MTTKQELIIYISLAVAVVLIVLYFFFLIHQARKAMKIAIPALVQEVTEYLDIYDFDDMGNTPLHISAMNNHESIAIFCLNKISAKSGISSWDDFNSYINRQNFCGDTPLHLAIRNNSKEVFDIIMRNRAVNVFIRNNLGKTPIDLAKSSENQYFISRLKYHKMHIDMEEREANFTNSL